MRILHVRFKNLNSLAGEWAIDFTAPAYYADGIFAITGPTGAGKTTILDAVCLALYGRTPRLNKVTKSVNEIMSRQTGECFAEVTFETSKGRFRSFWGQHRARRKPDGELQPPKHEIADADTGRVIESKLREVTAHVETVTGMDYDRFTRSMLLAQGGFAVFLQAPPDERAPILEQITGTEIYSRISMQIHLRRTAEQKELESLQAALDGMTFLSPEEEQVLKDRLQERADQEMGLSRRCDDLRKAIAWLAGISDLEREHADLDTQAQDFNKRQQDFAPELKRLDRARQALVVAGDVAGLAGMRAQQEAETRALQADRQKLPGIEDRLAGARAAQQAAVEKLHQSRETRTREAAVIKRVREMDVKLAETRKRRAAADDAVSQTARECEAYRHQIETEEVTLAELRVQCREIDDYLSRNAADGGLVTDILVIGNMFERLRETEKKHRDMITARQLAERENNNATAAYQKRSAMLEKKQAALSAKEADRRVLSEQIRILLKDRSPGDWRRELDALKDRRRLLDQTAQTLTRMDTMHRELGELTSRHASLSLERVQIRAAIKSEAETRRALETEVRHLTSRVTLLSRIRDLEAQRAHLEDGKPCPLCGATDHPFAAGNVPEMTDAQTAWTKAREAVKKVAERLVGLQIRQAETDKDIEQNEQDRKRHTARLAADEKQCAEALAELKLDVTSENRFKTVTAASDALRDEIAAYQSTIASVEKASKKESVAIKALEKTQQAYANAEKAQQAARHRQATAVRDLERLTRESGTLEEEAARAAQAALAGVGAYGITELVVDDLDDVLEQLTQRRNDWQACEKKKAVNEKLAARLTASVAEKKALLMKAESDCQVKRQALETTKNEVDTQDKDRRDLYGEENPDDAEKRLDAAVASADKALVAARETCSRIEKDLGGLEATIASLTQSTRARQTALAQQEEQLRKRLARAGFRDEPDYTAARLPEKERHRLEKTANALDREKTELHTRQTDNRDRLTRERGKKITEKPIETLEQETTACENSLKTLQQETGAITRQLAENKQMRDKHAAGAQKIAARKKECDRWDALHELIGSADGKKYRNFAQGLTFEMMVAHANRQLMKMTDRYLLVRDGANPLELHVIDNYQAGEIRTTKNLSGGESFIVSLALALGLSGMASRNVRVDSLFLDEGFGTLDEDALETALETLSGLQQDGKLIGVISHLPALKDRIATRIQVAPKTGGRSILTGPGCQRI